MKRIPIFLLLAILCAASAWAITANVVDQDRYTLPEGTTDGHVATWYSAANAWVAEAAPAIGGYTDITEFVEQTAWRLFYSDGSGDIKELALGTSGQYLKSQGATSIPTWDTPAGDSFDATALDDVTWGAAADGSKTWTIDTGSGTDPAIGFSDSGFTFNLGVTVPTEAYDATGWNDDLTAPTKDAVRDKVESLVTGNITLNDGEVVGKLSGTYQGIAISALEIYKILSGAAPTIDAAGKVAIDTTSDQLAYYGGAKRVLPYIQYFSVVIPAPATADDINVLKAPYGMTILGISCIVQGTTSATGQLQECGTDGTSCTDLDSDIVCDADGAADDGSFSDAAIASGAWLRWKTTSLVDTPTFLTVTVKYSVVSD